jgi:DMSO/TMAO reductase YedYZ molybdopterin-dependent catalytic subunit
MQSKHQNIINKCTIFSILFIIFILSLSGCIEEQSVLDNVEIQDYNGEKLSSIYDFRENSIKGPQVINKTTYHLRITGLVTTHKNYTYNQTISSFDNYKKVITLYCVEGWNVKILWDGVLVEDLIKGAVPLKSANTIIFHAYDGYTTSLPLDYVIDNKILLAFKMNNVTLPSERGWPFQLVAESKWGYKWIKWITEIELSNNPNYKGYWERRGYSNVADLNKSFFET